MGVRNRPATVQSTIYEIWTGSVRVKRELALMPTAAPGPTSQAVVKVSTACEAQRSAPRRLRDTEISYGFSVSPRPLWPFYGSQPVDRTTATGC